MTCSASGQESKRRQIAIWTEKSRKEISIIDTTWHKSGRNATYNERKHHGSGLTGCCILLAAQRDLRHRWDTAVPAQPNLGLRQRVPWPTEDRSNRCHHCSSPAWPKGIYCKMQSRGKKGAATQRGPGQPSSAMNAARGAGFPHAQGFIQTHSWRTDGKKGHMNTLNIKSELIA